MGRAQVYTQVSKTSSLSPLFLVFSSQPYFLLSFLLFTDCLTQDFSFRVIVGIWLFPMIMSTVPFFGGTKYKYESKLALCSWNVYDVSVIILEMETTKWKSQIELVHLLTSIILVFK